MFAVALRKRSKVAESPDADIADSTRFHSSQRRWFAGRSSDIRKQRKCVRTENHEKAANLRKRFVGSRAEQR